MALAPRLSGKIPTQIRQHLRLQEQACRAACQIKLVLLRKHYVHAVPGPRTWPAIGDLPQSVARGHATDAEVVRLMVLVATGRATTIHDDLWRQRASDLYTQELKDELRTSA